MESKEYMNPLGNHPLISTEKWTSEWTEAEAEINFIDSVSQVEPNLQCQKGEWLLSQGEYSQRELDSKMIKQTEPTMHHPQFIGNCGKTHQRARSFMTGSGEQ